MTHMRQRLPTPGDASRALAPYDGQGPVPAAVWRLAVVVAFGAVMSGLDTSVANVGLDTRC